MSDQSLSQLLKSHQQRQLERKRENEQLRKETAATVNELTDSLNDHLNEGVSEVFVRQKELEQASRKLSTQTTKYAKQTKQWLTLVDEFNTALKELGDIKNWATVMENDMRTVMSTLEFVHQGNNNSSNHNNDHEEQH
ncbi:GCN5-like 1 [Phascolomyces articulosus]|uniref:Biogenesis of lysosome-related organelles complex 1 subunit 1 n=1 Tax=Phascolomyces articulosus TaxID=60185 RepID=A0AAD5K6H2_9FUNG|nr:GCN5-like 1 [Phascolomyces articulosus]